MRTTEPVKADARKGKEQLKADFFWKTIEVFCSSAAWPASYTEPDNSSRIEMRDNNNEQNELTCHYL